MRRSLLSFFVLGVLGIPAGLASAQGAAISTVIDPSVRAAGMGRASSALFWGGDPDHWANPALLGYQRGVRYESARTQLVPDLADDVHFTTKRITVGAYGLGIALAGKPLEDIGSVHLSYGMSEGTDGSGNSLGSFESYEDIDSWGIGLSLGQAVESIWRLRGVEPPAITRFADVALGLNRKDVVVVLSPDFSGTGEVSGRATAGDRGVFARLTPYDTFRRRGGVDSSEPPVRLRLDLGAGLSTLNHGPPRIDFGLGSGSEPLLEEKRTGLSGRVALHPASLDRALEGSRLGWLARSLGPLVSIGVVTENLTQRSESGPGTITESDIDKTGWEVGLLNMVWLRRGHIDDPDGTVIGTTTGWGLGFELAGAIGFRHDRATVPQAEGLVRVHRKSWAVFIDPLRLVDEL